MNTTIVTAIAEHRLLSFEYQGHHRIVEPHVYGSNNSEDAVLTFQVGGSSQSGGLPNWRRVTLAHVHNLQMLPQSFSGPRPAPSGKHSTWEVIYAIVK